MEGPKKKKEKKRQNKANKHSNSTFKKSTRVQEIVLKIYLPNLFYGRLVGFMCNLFTLVLKTHSKRIGYREIFR